MPKRSIKTLDVREYRPLSYPVEFRFYQRYTSHPNRQSGIQFLTHYNTHQRFRVTKDYIDYMLWGKEQGQARLPHRHQRVAFDFFDSLPPTKGEGEADPLDSTRWFNSQDPSLFPHPDVDHSFDPYKKVFSNPEHWNRMFSKRRPGEGDIRLDAIDSNSLLGPLTTQTDTQDTSYFHTETRGPTHGRVPGLNTPFLGEMDQKMMQAMSSPLNKQHTLTTREGRFSKIVYLNESRRHQVLSTSLAKELNTELDKATNAVYSKLTVLEAAQSGETDFFCGGMDLERLGFDLRMCATLREQAVKEKASLPSLVPQKRAAGASGGEEEVLSSLTSTLSRIASLERDAIRHEDRADELLREHASLICRIQNAPRPFMTLVNGKCRGTGCGMALACKFCGLKDISEFIFDGPHIGLTPYGGMTRWLARPETSLKFPGLAEFVVLSGTSLFAGDLLRLGWSDLFTPLSNVGYHIQEWFDGTEHMHDDAVAWQLGHLLDTCFKMKDAHSSEMERCALTPVRARWIEDAFADQPDIASLMATLGEMEKLSYLDTANTLDRCRSSSPYTLSSVEEGVKLLDRHQLRYTLGPFDVSPPSAELKLKVQQASELFTSYVLERRGSVSVSVHKNRDTVKGWHAQREKEYEAYQNLLATPHPRHVYVRLEGCENIVVDFDFAFEMPGGVKESEQRRAGETSIVLDQLRRVALKRLGMPEDRELELGWYLPTLDCCRVNTDQELLIVLQNDTGIEDPRENLKYPPLYFIAKRTHLYLSEWAYAVKHQLLLSCPTALRSAWEMLMEVRGDGSEEAVKTLAETLSIEFKYISRCMRRPDFYRVGQYTTLPPEEWERIKKDQETNLHHSMLPTRPLPQWSEVFERHVELDGHYFSLRPRWEPRTLEEVKEEEVSAHRAALDFSKDGIVPLYPDTYYSKADRLEGMVQDAGGVEVIPGLGERDKDGNLVVEPLRTAASVPKNVNFYQMARHPWNDTQTSWRQNDFTEGSKAYFEAQYKAAEKSVYDERSKNSHVRYWPSQEATEGTGAGTEDNDKLLEERLWGPLKQAERGVEGWARDLRDKALEGKLDYKLEIATQQEKIYDDEYYRWFISPDHHPNPSGLLLGRRGADVSSDKELDSFIEKLMSESLSSPGPVSAATEVEETEAFDEDLTTPVDIAESVEAGVEMLDDPPSL